MNKHSLFLLLCIATPCAYLHSKSDVKSNIKDVLTSNIKKGVALDITNTNKTAEEKKIWFRFKDEPLVDIINYLAAEKKINVVLPAGKEAITQKLTFQYPEKLTLSDAWQRLLTILRIAGFTVAPENDFYFVTGTSPKSAKDANRQSYPLYINIKASDLPDSDEKIRYVYYFSNLQVGSDGSATSSFGGSPNGGGSVASVLMALLSDDATLVTDSDSNGIIITDYARNIGSIMNILEELDQHGFTDAIDIIKLKHTNASTIAALFQSLINPNASSSSSSSSQYGGFSSSSITAGPSSETKSQYFARSTRIVPESRTNSLILMGKKDAIDKAIHFIKKHLDVPLGQGESVLHIYDLQYLKATDFQKTLQDIVNSTSNSSSSSGSWGSQSTGSTDGKNTGERYFKGVIIQAEMSNVTSYSSSSSNSSSFWSGSYSNAQGAASKPADPVQSSNRLIIAAVREDWFRIKKLIEELDKPQLQVAIEVLIVDLALERNKTFGSQIRNKKGLNLKNTNFQNATLGSLQLKGGATPSQTTVADALMGNLLQLSNSTNIANQTTGGSLVLSFKDSATNGMWLVTQILSKYKDVKILSQPFIVALNNQNSSFASNETRLLNGDVTIPPGGGASSQVTEPVTATLGVSITPLISASGKINLGINIAIQEFGDSDSKLTRNITTNANVNDGEVLVLGGLTKTKVTNDHAATPLMSKIPVLGWLFKRKDKNTVKDNLLVFICPRIINTRPDQFFDPFTKNKMLTMSNVLAKSENFESLKDPITHWFFGSRDSEIATKRITQFEQKKMFVDDNTYNFDRYNSSARIITIDTNDTVDNCTIMPRHNVLPPPEISSSDTSEDNVSVVAKTIEKSPTRRKVSDHIHVDKTEIPKKLAQRKIKKTKLTEEQEFKNLFSQLQKPLS